MASKPQPDVTAVRIPLAERERMDRLAGRVGCSRSKLLRAAFLAVEAEDPDLIRARLAKLTPDVVETWRPRPRTAA
jgi:predicted DNA-binding protein